MVLYLLSNIDGKQIEKDAHQSDHGDKDKHQEVKEKEPNVEQKDVKRKIGLVILLRYNLYMSLQYFTQIYHM